MAYGESGEGAGSTYGVFVRPTNGDPAVRLLDAGGGLISPDGKQVAAGIGSTPNVVTIASTGAGATRSIALPRLEAITTVRWFPDSRRLVALANEPGRPPRSWEVDTVTGTLAPLTDEGARGLVVSPNGRLLAVGAGDKRYLLDLQTKKPIPLVKGIEPADTAAGFTADSSGLFVFQREAQGGRIFRIDLATGTRTPVRTLHQPDPSGQVLTAGVSVALDGEHLVYHTGWEKSQLFLLKLPQQTVTGSAR